MGLLARNHIANSATQYYTLGSQKSYLLVGLGNPGKEYDGTRHNIGFAAIDAFAAANNFPNWVHKRDLKCQLTATTLGSNKVILVKPATYMNLSGEAVRAVIDFYKLTLNSTIVVHDELDIPFGQIRTRMGGSSAGHNGLKSIIQHGGENFGRVRIGIGQDPKPRQDSADFVLARFSKEEAASVPALLQETNSILTEYIYGGQLLADTRNVIIKTE